MVSRTPRAPERRGSITRALPSRNGLMRAAVDTLEKVLSYDANLLLLGESGVGKDHIARTIHRFSRRATGPFVTIDCAGIPFDLLESELFGHEKGSFTDAKEARPGKLEAGRGGIVYLDEVGALSPSHQAKLLRVIDQKSFTRIGGRSMIDLDIRIISSSNRNLELAVERGEFRADLFYRLNVVAVTIPPLRERREDIVALARGMLREAARRHRKNVTGMTREVETLLKGYPWPGNLRELASVIDRAVLVEDSDTLVPASLPRETFGSAENLLEIALPARWTLEELEKRYIRAVIEECGGNYSRAARFLGISRKALLEKRRRFGLDVPARPGEDADEGGEF